MHHLEDIYCKNHDISDWQTHRLSRWKDELQAFLLVSYYRCNCIIRLLLIIYYVCYYQFSLRKLLEGDWGSSITVCVKIARYRTHISKCLEDFVVLGFKHHQIKTSRWCHHTALKADVDVRDGWLRHGALNFDGATTPDVGCQGWFYEGSRRLQRLLSSTMVLLTAAPCRRLKLSCHQ